MSNFHRPKPLLNTQSMLNNLRNILTTTTAASRHPDNVATATALNDKATCNNTGDGPGKQRFWQNLQIHHKQYEDDGGVLNLKTYGKFFKPIYGMRNDGVMSWEIFHDVLVGDWDGWIKVHETEFGTDPNHIAIMRKGRGEWFTYYREVLVKGRDPESVRLRTPQSAQKKTFIRRKRKRPLAHISVLPDLYTLPPPLKRRKISTFAPPQPPPPPPQPPLLTHGQHPISSPFKPQYTFTPIPQEFTFDTFGTPFDDTFDTPFEDIFTTQQQTSTRMPASGYDLYIAATTPKHQIPAVIAYSESLTTPKPAAIPSKKTKRKKKVKKPKTKTKKSPLADLQDTLNKLVTNQLTKQKIPRRHKVVLGVAVFRLSIKENDSSYPTTRNNLRELLDLLFETDESDSYQLGASHTMGLLDKDGKEIIAKPSFEAYVKTHMYDRNIAGLKTESSRIIEGKDEGEESDDDGLPAIPDLI